MADKEYRIQVNPNALKVRDEAVKEMITATGGVTRVFVDRKKKLKADRAERKAKYKTRLD